MDKQLTTLETVFKALADSTRLRILALLTTGEVCVCNVHDTLRIPQPKASRHLAYLRRAGLVETRRDGLWIHYRLAPQSNRVIAAVEEAVRDALAESPAIRRDLERLKRQTDCEPGAPDHTVQIIKLNASAPAAASVLTPRRPPAVVGRAASSGVRHTRA